MSTPSFERTLRSIRAPKTLLPAIIAQIGLANRYVKLESPLGFVYVAFNNCGITEVRRTPNFAKPARHTNEVPRYLERALSGDSAAIKKLQFDLSALSEFERAVLRKAAEIPRGQIRPYGWIAREIGRPKAVRAVGTALAKNPVPLLIPCHRIVRTDGTRSANMLGGPRNKRRVLATEGVPLETVSRYAKSGVRYLGTKTTGIYCFPLCSHAQRITSKHRILLHSQHEAEENGLRPCKVCRPAEAA